MNPQSPVIPSTSSSFEKYVKAVTLGIIRLDYEYPPAPGDIDHPDSYEYDVHYRMIPGFTFEMC